MRQLSGDDEHKNRDMGLPPVEAFWRHFLSLGVDLRGTCGYIVITPIIFVIKHSGR